MVVVLLFVPFKQFDNNTPMETSYPHFHYPNIFDKNVKTFCCQLSEAVCGWERAHQRIRGCERMSARAHKREHKLSGKMYWFWKITWLLIVCVLLCVVAAFFARSVALVLTWKFFLNRNLDWIHTVEDMVNGKVMRAFSCNRNRLGNYNECLKHTIHFQQNKRRRKKKRELNNTWWQTGRIEMFNCIII